MLTTVLALFTKSSTLVTTSVKAIPILFIIWAPKSDNRKVLLYSGGNALLALVNHTPPVDAFPVNVEAATTFDSGVPMVGVVATPDELNLLTRVLPGLRPQSRTGRACR